METNSKSKSKLKLCYDRQQVSQSVLVSSTHLGLKTRFFFCVWQLWVCWCGTSTLTIRRVCLWQCTMYYIFTFCMLLHKCIYTIYTTLLSGQAQYNRSCSIFSRSSSPDRVKNFLFSMSSRLALGPTQPPIQWVPGALSPGVKRPGREADHSPPTSAEVKKMRIYISTPPYAFKA
jgi:hypothetical protein